MARLHDDISLEDSERQLVLFEQDNLLWVGIRRPQQKWVEVLRWDNIEHNISYAWNCYEWWRPIIRDWFWNIRKDSIISYIWIIDLK